MTRLRRKLGKLAAIFLLVGIVLSPLRAAAATIPMLFAYDETVRATTTVRVETRSSVRPEQGGIPDYAYDEARDGYDDIPNAPAVAGARGVYAYDYAVELLEQREVAKGAFYDALVATTAAEEA